MAQQPKSSTNAQTAKNAAHEPSTHEPGAQPPQPRADEPKPPLPEVKPDPSMETIADEQRRRSDEIAAIGTDKWVAEHDERTEEEKAGKPVAGVAHRPVGEHEASTSAQPHRR